MVSAIIAITVIAVSLLTFALVISPFRICLSCLVALEFLDPTVYVGPIEVDVAIFMEFEPVEGNADLFGDSVESVFKFILCDEGKTDFALDDNDRRRCTNLALL